MQTTRPITDEPPLIWVTETTKFIERNKNLTEQTFISILMFCDCSIFFMILYEYIKIYINIYMMTLGLQLLVWSIADCEILVLTRRIYYLCYYYHLFFFLSFFFWAKANHFSVEEEDSSQKKKQAWVRNHSLVPEPSSVLDCVVTRSRMRGWLRHSPEEYEWWRNMLRSVCENVSKLHIESRPGPTHKL